MTRGANFQVFDYGDYRVVRHCCVVARHWVNGHYASIPVYRRLDFASPFNFHDVDCGQQIHHGKLRNWRLFEVRALNDSCHSLRPYHRANFHLKFFDVLGTSCLCYHTAHAPVAQWIEQQTSNL